MVAGSETWGALKADYNKAATNPFGGFFGGVAGYLRPKHWGEQMPQAVVDAAWRTPKAAIMSTVLPIRNDIFKIVPTTKESLSTFQTEMIKDIFKPIAYTIGHIRHRIFKGLSLTDPVSWLRSAWGIVTAPIAVLAGVGAGLAHIPGDALALGPMLLGATTKTIGGVGQHFFSGMHNFGKGMLVTSDVMERAANRIFVPEAWAEPSENEYEHITTWGSEFSTA